MQEIALETVFALPDPYQGADGYTHTHTPPKPMPMHTYTYVHTATACQARCEAMPLFQ